MENFICSRHGERLHILNTENIKICMHFLPYLLNIYKKLTFFISQGSVLIYLWVLSYVLCFVANFIRFPAVQKFWISVKIWRSYKEFNGGNFCWDTVYRTITYFLRPRTLRFSSVCLLFGLFVITITQTGGANFSWNFMISSRVFYRIAKILTGHRSTTIRMLNCTGAVVESQFWYHPVPIRSCPWPCAVMS